MYAITTGTMTFETAHNSDARAVDARASDKSPLGGLLCCPILMISSMVENLKFLDYSNCPGLDILGSRPVSGRVLEKKLSFW